MEPHSLFVYLLYILHKERNYGMRQIKNISFICVCIICLTIMWGCEEQIGSSSENTINLYYLNESGTALKTVSYELKSEAPEDKINEIMCAMRESRKDVNKAIPDEIKFISYELSGQVLSLNMDSAYLNLDSISEIFVRAAVVLTFTQLDEVSYVSFYVNNNPVKDSNGDALVMISHSDFIDKVGGTLNNYENTTVTLYYANYSGNKLKTEIRTGMYDSSQPIEQYIVEQLIKGPAEEGNYRTLPQNSNIRSISTNNGVCYIDFDSNFLSGASSVKDEIMIYSIVNSLTELSHINKVQISVNGDIDVELHNRFSLNQLLVRDLSYMEN